MRNEPTKDRSGELAAARDRRSSLAAYLTLHVNVAFLGTLAIFLAVGFWSERRLHYRDTFHHLEEALEVLGLASAGRTVPEPDSLATIEGNLARHSGIPHRVLVLGRDGKVDAASRPALIGRSLQDSFAIDTVDSSNGRWALVTGDGERWLAASTTSISARQPGAGIVLLRARRASDDFIGRFVAIHALHVALAVPLFAVVVGWIVKRRVSQPIARLVTHLTRVEEGRFEGYQAPGSDDEIGWLGERLTAMGRRLQTTIDRLVRIEKHATAGAVALRIAREMSDPLDAMGRRLVMLEAVGFEDDEVRRLCGELSADRDRLVDVVTRLQQIEGPAPSLVEPEPEGADRRIRP